MAVVGDRVEIPSKRVGQAPREGVVTGVSGGLLRVTWSGGEESTITPSMGSLVVLGKVKVRPKKGAATAKATAKEATATKAPAKKSSKSSTKTSKGSTGPKGSGARSASKRSQGARKRGK
jgi:hypothetical protein